MEPWDIFFKSIQSIGVLITGISAYMAYRSFERAGHALEANRQSLDANRQTLHANHDWNRRQFAIQLIEKWNPNTKSHRRAIEKILPGIVDANRGENIKNEITKKRLRLFMITTTLTVKIGNCAFTLLSC